MAFVGGVPRVTLYKCILLKQLLNDRLYLKILSAACTFQSRRLRATEDIFPTGSLLPLLIYREISSITPKQLF